MNKIRVLVADDHRLFREGIKRMFSNVSDIDVAAEANNGQEVMDIVEHIPIDVVIMDIDMPVLNGIETTKILTEKYENIHVLVLSMYSQKSFVENVFKLGAKGYLKKDTDFENLYKAVKAVAEGKMFFNKHIMFNNIEEVELTRSGKLSEKELIIIKYISEGLQSKHIGDKLNVSARTIDNYKAHIMKKLKVENNVQLITYGIETGILKHQDHIVN